MWTDDEVSSVQERGSRYSGDSEVVLIDDNTLPRNVQETPIVAQITNSSQVHVGPKIVTVNQTVHNGEILKGRFLCLELVSPNQSNRLRCGVAVFVCWALVVASSFGVYFLFIIYNHNTRFDIPDLPFHQYVWKIVRNSTKAERLSCAVAFIAIAICIAVIVIYTVTVNNSDEEEGPNDWFIQRDQWLARSFNNTDPLPHEFEPPRLVIINHSVSGKCTTFAMCAAAMRNLQHIDYDIVYNFVVGNDGRVYEGRGWRKEGAHCRGYNKCGLGVGFIGDYRNGNTEVTETQLTRCKMLFDVGVEKGFLHKNYYVVGAKDIQASESPGENLYNAIKEWEHYDHQHRMRNKNCSQIYSMEFESDLAVNDTLSESQADITTTEGYHD